VPAKGRTGVVYRHGEETVAEAYERDARGPGDRPPKRKQHQQKKASAPTEQDLREVEKVLADMFRSPAFLAAGFGDSWAADHFTRQGPELARNLVHAARFNPWLREKLLAATTDPGFAMRLASLVYLGVSAVGYILPPIIWWTGTPAPKVRELYGIPSPAEKEMMSRARAASTPTSAPATMGAAAAAA
jgi:hypothetical protein